MKPSTLLLQAALVAGGLFLYHTLFAPAPARPGADLRLAVDDLGDPAPAGRSADADHALAERNAVDIAQLRRELAALQARERAGGAAPEDGPRPDPAPGEARRFERIDPRDPTFDDDDLATLGLMMDELSRRRAEARNRKRLVGELDRVGVDLPEQQQEAVIDATLAYQQQARDLLQQPWSGDEAGRAARNEALGRLQKGFETTIRGLVDAETAEKITGSRLARMYGSFFDRKRGGGAGGGPR